MIFSNPRISDKTYIKFFTHDYRELYTGSEKPPEDYVMDEFYKGKEIYESITKHISLKKAKIVEIGVGAGGILHYFKTRGHTCYGVDFDEEYLESGRKKGLHLYQGDIKKIINKKIKADLVVYSHTLDHIAHINKEIENIKKILKPKGRLFIRVPGIKNLHNKYWLNFLVLLQIATPYRFTARTLDNLMKQHGFKSIHTNEIVDGIYEYMGKKQAIENDYTAIKKYLLNTEKKYERRYLELNYLKTIFINEGAKIARKIGLYKTLKKILEKIRK